MAAIIGVGADCILDFLINAYSKFAELKKTITVSSHSFHRSMASAISLIRASSRVPDNIYNLEILFIRASSKPYIGRFKVPDFEVYAI